MHRTANYSTLTTHTPIPKFLDAIGAAQSDINRRNSRKTNPLSQPTAISDKIGRLCLQIVGLLREVHISSSSWSEFMAYTLCRAHHRAFLKSKIEAERSGHVRSSHKPL